MTPVALRGLRVVLGATQSAFALVLGVSERTLQRYERGETLPGRCALKALQEIRRER